MHTGSKRQTNPTADHQNLSLSLGQRTSRELLVTYSTHSTGTPLMLTGIGDRLVQPADHQNLSLLLGHKYAIDQALSIGSIG